VANETWNGCYEVKESRKLNKWQELSLIIDASQTGKVIISSFMN
jgi:hypothetical protein